MDVIQIVFYLLALVMSISFHEFAHAWLANEMGDATARNQGRLTLKHGAGSGTIPLAVSDAAGVWRIVARDVATGVEGAATFTVS